MYKKLAKFAKPMELITYNISQEIPAEGNPGIRIKSIAFTIEMPDGKVCNIVLNNTQERLVSLKTKTYGQFCIPLSDIVMICPTDKADFVVEGNSNNKAIFFTNRRPDIINNFSASHDIQDKLGVPPNEFVCVNRGWYVNRTHIVAAKDHAVIVEYVNSSNEKVKTEIKTSRNGWRNVNKRS